MLSNYVLWYNQYENLWYAIDRNYQISFFGGKRVESVYFVSAKVNDLIKQLK